jgi:hypothetical protein
MSDTPETDAQVTTFTSISKLKKRFEVSTGKVSAEFARKLERERDELRRERDEALVLAGGASTLRELANLHVEALLCWSTAERERDEERAITFRQADCIEELESERDDARRASARWKSAAKDWRRFYIELWGRHKRFKEASK